MNFFNLKTTWKNWEFIPLKLCIAAAYLLIGAYFQEWIRNHYMPLLLLFVVCVLWAVYLWISKLRKEN